MSNVELTTMVMIEDKSAGKVLAHDRLIRNKGLSFPGGHVEDGESICDCAVREIREETGLTIRNLKSCGIAHWLNKRTSMRYLVFLYKTGDYSGELIDETEEGRNFWMDADAFRNLPPSELSANWHVFRPMLFEEKYNEVLCLEDEGGTNEVIYL